MTKEILTRNTDDFINFRGFMVGNPYVDPYTNTMTQIQAYYAHGLLAKPLYDKWLKSCSDPDVYDKKVRDTLCQFMDEQTRTDLSCR